MKAFIEVMVVLAVIGVIAFLVAIAAQKPVSDSGELKEKTYIAVIEGCQYVVVQGGSGNTKYFSMTHKGNCTNH